MKQSYRGEKDAYVIVMHFNNNKVAQNKYKKQTLACIL